MKVKKIIIKNDATFVILGNIEINGSTDSKVKILGQEPGYGSVISYNNFFKAKYLDIKIYQHQT